LNGFIKIYFSLRREKIHLNSISEISDDLLGGLYEGVSKIFRTDAVKFISLTTKRVWKLPTSTQLRVTWHTDSLGMVVLPFTGASSYHNCCIDGGNSPEYFGLSFYLDPNKETD
jgi:hypothetical protein